MCRLFAKIGKKMDVGYWFFEASPAFKEFSERIINRGPHNSGWGIAWMDKSWNIFKQGKEEKFDFSKVREIQSELILIHLRHASVGDETKKNAHPFIYKNWVFAHNGGVNRKKAMEYLKEKYKKTITTDTDSEVYFLLIMQYLEETKDIILAIKKTLELVKKFSYRGLNFIMSDGKNLYAYRDVSPEHNDKINYYTLYYQHKDGIVICSDPLSKEKWTSVDICQLIHIDKNLNLVKIKL